MIYFNNEDKEIYKFTSIKELLSVWHSIEQYGVFCWLK